MRGPQIREFDEGEFAFWLEHVPKDDPNGLNQLIIHYASDITLVG